jgi:hypothetical protein
MEEGVGPSSSSVPGMRHTPANSHDTSTPMRLLARTIDYGTYTWEKINSLRGTDNIITPLLNLTYIIEDQIQNILELHNLYRKDFLLQPTLSSIIEYYSQPEILACQVTHAPAHNIALQLLSRSNIPRNTPDQNYYHHLPDHDDHDRHLLQTMSQSTSSFTPSTQVNPPNKPSYFVEDLNVSEVSEIVRAQVLKDNTHMEIEKG